MKKNGIAVALLLLLTCGSALSQEVQSGAFSAGAGTPNYTLDKGSGPRTFSIEVSYPKGFDVKPDILISVNSLDADASTNIRYEVVAKGISRDGFVITIKTWSESKIFNIGGSWLAVSGGKQK